MKRFALSILISISLPSFAGISPAEAIKALASTYRVETPEDQVADIYTFTVNSDLSVSYPNQNPMWHFDQLSARLEYETIAGESALPILEVSAVWANDEIAHKTIFRFVALKDANNKLSKRLLDVVELENNFEYPEESSARSLKNSKLLSF